MNLTWWIRTRWSSAWRALDLDFISVFCAKGSLFLPWTAERQALVTLITIVIASVHFTLITIFIASVRFRPLLCKMPFYSQSPKSKALVLSEVQLHTGGLLTFFHKEGITNALMRHCLEWSEVWFCSLSRIDAECLECWMLCAWNNPPLKKYMNETEESRLCWVGIFS